MNTITRILLSLVLFHCALPATDSDPVKEIDTLLTSWHRAAAVADEAVYFGAMADDFVFLGTDAGERWNKKEFEAWSRKYFQRDSAWVFTSVKRYITLSDDGRTAWFDELLDSKSYWPTRGSGILTLTDEGWKLRQYNMAFTIPNESVGEIRPFIEKAFRK